MHRCADEIRIFEAGRLIAVHAVLEGRHRRVAAAGHRRLPPPANSRMPRADEPLRMARASEQAGRRPVRSVRRHRPVSDRPGRSLMAGTAPGH